MACADRSEERASLAAIPPALADAVEQGGEAVAAALLEHMRERTGRAASFVPAERPGAVSGSERAAVARDGQTYGWLESSEISASELAPWAESLAAFLAAADRWRRLNELAYADPLTGAGNRRDFERFASQAIEQAAARGRPMAMMVLDLDNFKQYNDRFGHAAGDEVLRETVALLRSVVRRGDRVFRIGGDEFVVVFADPSSPRSAGSGPVESVDQIASRFRSRIAELQLPQLGALAPGAVTVSAGLATYPRDGADAATLLAAADERALASKRKGKNLITFGGA